MTRVAVLGANGRMGRTVCDAVTADDQLELVACVDPHGEGSIHGVRIVGDREVLRQAAAEVAVDFTHPDQVLDNVRFCVAAGIHCVVGTSGLKPPDLEEISGLVESADANVFVAPNFSIGAVLMMQFAARAARLLGSAEVIELHHNNKLDAPSGTGAATARLIAGTWSTHGRPPGGEPHPSEAETYPGARGADVDGVRVHSVRLRGLVAHQEVVLGGPGEILTIRHDSMDRESFMPGVLLAVKSIAAARGLTVGLEAFLDL